MIFVKDILFIVFPRHEAVAAGFVGFEVGAAEEGFDFAFLHDQVAVLAFVAFEDGHIAATEVVGHEVADFGLVGANPELEADVGLVAELQGVAADRAAFDVFQIVGGLVVELAVHCD